MTQASHAPDSPARGGPAVRLIVGLLSGIGLAMALNQVLNLGAFGFRPISTGYYYWIAAAFFPIAFLMLPARAADRHRLPWYDILAAILSLAVGIWLAFHAEEILLRGWDLEAPLLPTLAATALVLLSLEGLRRAGGFSLFLICLFFATYPLYAGEMPGVLFGFQFTPEELVRAHALGSESIIGIPMRVVTELLIGFLLFGVALTRYGGGAFFMNLATALMGRYRGGPAKVAILSSGFFGSLSGSVISNVISTGAMTIPTMKRCGYPARYAAAIESCASTGGALMPPVMGVVAFIMANFLNVAYAEVMLAAAAPAVLFYAALLFQVDAYAARNDLATLPQDEVPSVWRILLGGWSFLVSFVVLIWLIVGERMEGLAPYVATALVVGVGAATTLVREGPWAMLRQLGGLFFEGGRNIAQLVVLLAGIGLIIGALSITGVGTAFSRELLQYAGDSIVLLLLLGALTSFVLGMGITASACYIFLAIILGPPLVEAGLNPMASHLFILYWGMLSFITPPVALAAVAAAGIAGSNPMSTGVMAVRFGLVLFFLPFLFVLNPALILQGSFLDIVLAVGTALASVWLFSVGVERWLYGIGRIGWPLAGLALAASFTLLIPEHNTDLIGAGLVALLYGAAYLMRRRPAPA
ncbi:MAG: TRAP transporter fused permease subunit [Sneathiellaceae bacterium]